MKHGGPGKAYPAAFLLGGLMLCVPVPAGAHAFGARYDLPLPLDLYLAGAGLVVLLTFVASAVLLRRRRFAAWHVDFDMRGLVGARVAKGLAWLGSAIGLFLFALVLGSALVGNESPTRNFAPAFVWVIWWVGLVYAAALIADIWPWLNPWRSIALVAERLAGVGPFPPRLRYPAVVGHWPAVTLFLAFAWIELVSDAGEAPRTLALLILAYSALTAAGALVFGAKAWLGHGEVFAVVFGLFGRFAPLRFQAGGLRLRCFAHGLLVQETVPTALMIFVALMLSTVTFDGFLETPVWSGILDWIVADTTLRPLLLSLREAGIDLLAAIKSIALLIFPLIFLGIYLLFCRVIVAVAGPPLSTLGAARGFVFSLVPIAIAYHLAHYYSFLLLAGQLIIPLLSDPFGLGWNLFGTAHYTMDITVVSAKTTWYLAVGAIVLGHVIAVLVGHLTALRLYRSPRAAVLSQVPMTLLMVAYSMLSLWILSQPIVESPSF